MPPCGIHSPWGRMNMAARRMVRPIEEKSYYWVVGWGRPEKIGQEDRDAFAPLGNEGPIQPNSKKSTFRAQGGYMKKSRPHERGRCRGRDGL